SYFNRALNSGRPTTSAAYLARLDVPGANSWSCAFEVLEPVMGAIPVQRAPDAFAQPYTRRVADFGPRPRDVERAALGEEVHPPAVDWRLDAQRHAHRLDERAGNPERPYRQMPA